MRALIVEDDFRSRMLLQKYLTPFFEVHIAVDGKEALQAFNLAVEDKQPYDLICLDILLPRLDGQEFLKEIRKLEESMGIFASDSVRVVMTSALKDSKNVLGAFKTGCEAYLVKPFDRTRFLNILEKLKLIDKQKLLTKKEKLS
ncbi:MAG: response regulator [Calditrichaeota bacterium]|nr:MAG: response regulator [Calditrichota bacterium]MBL1203993.1 response regulator [Calditrichota bacterium]NOG43824.1 response regulator [Calditrichota bacterium]